VLATYLFLVLVVYFALSGPVNVLFDAFQGANWAAAEGHKAGYMSLIRQAMTVTFAIFICIPITWFFFWVFHREPAWNQVDNSQWRR
jgi:heme/copper-type cytochrome/quinol oxidase subunit 2